MKEKLIAKLDEIHERLSARYNELNEDESTWETIGDYSEQMDFLEGQLEVLAEIEYFVKHMED